MLPDFLHGGCFSHHDYVLTGAKAELASSHDEELNRAAVDYEVLQIALTLNQCRRAIIVVDEVSAVGPSAGILFFIPSSSLQLQMMSALSRRLLMESIVPFLQASHPFKHRQTVQVDPRRATWIFTSNAADKFIHDTVSMEGGKSL